MTEQTQVLPTPTVITADDIASSAAATKIMEAELTLGVSLTMLAEPSILASRLDKRFTEYRSRRLPFETEWLDAYQRHNGQYSAEALAKMDPKKSKLWINITAMKDNSAHAAIMDFLRGTGTERPFSLTPIEIPDEIQLPPEMQRAGATVDDIRKLFKMRSKALENEIGNQLDQTDGDEMLSATSYEMVIAGTGALKGPFTVKNKRKSWQFDFSGASALAQMTEVDSPDKFLPNCANVSLFNIYPDLDAPNIQNGRGLFEEMSLSRSQMLDLALLPKINMGAVLAALRDGPNQSVETETTQRALRAIAGDTSPYDSNRYVVRAWYGEITGEELQGTGLVEVPTEMREMVIRGEVWYCGKYILKAQVWNGPLPYYLIPYVPRGPVPYGKGIPMLGKNSQDWANGSGRVLMDNAAVASGPIVEINKRICVLNPGQDPADVGAWSVVVTDHPGDPGVKAIVINELPAYTQQFMMMLDKALQRNDDETFIPSITQGVQGVGTTKTARGMMLLNQNANKTLKGVMRSMDDNGIEPLIEALVDWNMRYNPKETIQVPVKVIAKGSSALLAAETKTQRMLTLLQIIAANPNYKEDELVFEIARMLGVDPREIQLTDDEKAAIQQAMGTQGQQPPGPGAGKAAPKQIPAQPDMPGVQGSVDGMPMDVGAGGDGGPSGNDLVGAGA